MPSSAPKIGDLVRTVHHDNNKVETGIIVETQGRSYYRIKFFNYTQLSWYEEEEIEPA